ncbi:CoA-binding protein [Anaerobium acetethylicum]|uniref:CoA-binding domain-containing protein n=1 Tax=Anaerobium acetethylicum TaxID=1619234 RepID=A0A1D3TPP7_9FIRM|nr:CoA-binding protein [Anaerobium acetethylicum]SCP95420.1 hypothetical protein SAMN05421730_1001554 [Anaerobium acetethylicum]
MAVKLAESTKKWAVIGVTTDQDKYGYKIFKRLRDIGAEVYGISPKYCEACGCSLYNNVCDIPDGVEVAVFVVNPKIGLGYIKDCAEKNIRTIWLQPGTVSFEILQEAKKYDLDVVQKCVLVETSHMV